MRPGHGLMGSGYRVLSVTPFLADSYEKLDPDQDLDSQRVFEKLS